MSKKISRSLKVITGELQIEMKRETNSIITIGNLLLEAHEQIEHGAWLDWLGENFSMSVSSCENYMNAARAARKFPTVANLKLRASALYLLGNQKDDDELFDVNAIKAILAEAETKWVSETRAWNIAISMRPKPADEAEIVDWDDAEEEAEAEMAEVDAILDGAPPELPAPPEAVVHDVILPSFDQAIKTLTGLQTKPLSKFTDTTYAPNDIRSISDFLREVADNVDRKSRPQAAA